MVENFDQLFPDNRETGDTPLRQCQLVMLRMLKNFDYLCKKHGIKYFLTGGSLIGAVRHNGFIPRDDDLDVGMTRRNYELFVQKAVNEFLRLWQHFLYFFTAVCPKEHIPYNGKIFYSFARIAFLNFLEGRLYLGLVQKLLS